MRILIFLGTVRDSTPPDPPRLGLRVARTCQRWLENLEEDHDIELIDPLDHDLGGVFKPHFSYRKSDVPEPLQSLAEKIEAADACVMVSPEYNHSMSPALAHLLNHFGSSLFSWKPSAIVTYSAGQWGGVRAAVAMRSFLSELGCLPVSAMIHVPAAQNVLNEDGTVQEEREGKRWNDYLGRTLLQLLWWGEAASRQRDSCDPDQMVRPFKRDPSQRNAPG